MINAIVMAANLLMVKNRAYIFMKKIYLISFAKGYNVNVLFSDDEDGGGACLLLQGCYSHDAVSASSGS